MENHCLGLTYLLFIYKAQDDIFGLEVHMCREEMNTKDAHPFRRCVEKCKTHVQF